MTEKGEEEWINVEMNDQPEDLGLVLQWSFFWASIPQERALAALQSSFMFPNIAQIPRDKSH